MRRRKRPVKVEAIPAKDRPSYRLKITWPDKRVTWESSGTPRKREAERIAARKERELSEGYADDGDRIPWAVFATDYRRIKLASLDETGVTSFNTASDRLTALCGVKYLDEVDSACLAELWTLLCEKYPNNSPETHHSVVARLRAAVNFAHEMGWTDTPVTFRRKQKKKQMKGRPITEEEFERMLAQLPSVLSREEHVASWKFYLRGMWLSSLRREESLEVYWDRDDKIRVVGIDRQNPMLCILGDLEKGGQDRLWPIPPDFADHLRAVPRAQRKGRVFNPLVLDRRGNSRPTSSLRQITKIVSKLGQLAKVVVKKTPKRVQCATLHDLRRSYAERWTPHVDESILTAMMRHESIETTRKYYSRGEAIAMSDRINKIYEEAFGARVGAVSGAVPQEASDQEEKAV